MKNELLQNHRNSYNLGKLDLEDLNDDPKLMVGEWLDMAKKADLEEPTAMSLATASKDGQPSIRTVLLKEITEEGFVFYTNYKSRKAREIEQNKKGALLFFWSTLERQIRIEGHIEKVSRETSIKYFQSRPKGSQIGAWASPQSEIIAGRSILNDRVTELSDVYREIDRLPLPTHWGGYVLVPNYYEFWQGRENRMHDRFEFRKRDNEWEINRLAP